MGMLFDRSFRFYLVIGVLLVGLVEVVSFGALEYVFVPRGYVYKPQLQQTSEAYARHERAQLIPWGLGYREQPTLLSPNHQVRS